MSVSSLTIAKEVKPRIKECISRRGNVRVEVVWPDLVLCSCKLSGGFKSIKEGVIVFSTQCYL